MARGCDGFQEASMYAAANQLPDEMYNAAQDAAHKALCNYFAKQQQACVRISLRFSIRDFVLK